MNKIIIKNFTR